MRLSDFYAQIQSIRSDAHEYIIQLAQADAVRGDDIDVQLSEIGWVELDYSAAQARLYPRSAVTESSPDQLVATLEMLLEYLPFDDTGDCNPIIVAELPIDREGPGLIRPSLEEVRYLHIGIESKEAWLVVGSGETLKSEVLPA